MSATRGIWEQLRADAAGETSGSVNRRIHADSPHDLWIAIDLTTGHRQLIHYHRATRGTTPELPQSRAVSAHNRTLPDGTVRTTVALLDPGFTDVFTSLVEDVASAAATTSDDHGAEAALAARLWHWKRLLEGLSDEGLSEERRLGLVGELLVLRRLISRGVAVPLVVRGWTGPMGTDQDLQVGAHAIEVKTTRGHEPLALRISSERQLDDTGLATLHLVHVSMDVRRGGTGESLNTVADDLMALARRHPPADTELAARFHQGGYLVPLHRHFYNEPRYTLRSLTGYRIRDGFPRIVEPLATGLGNVTYDLALTACENFRVPDSELVDPLNGAGT